MARRNAHDQLILIDSGFRHAVVNPGIQSNYLGIVPTMGAAEPTCPPSHMPGRLMLIRSPDGKFVAIENRLADINQNELYLINFDRKAATKIDENIFPIGWLQPAQ